MKTGLAVRYLSLGEVLELHRLLLQTTGGGAGLRDLGQLESALHQPRQTFGGDDLYRTLEEKAVALGYSLIQNHPFVDGNKRVGHAAMETFLVLNGWELKATVEEAEDMILAVASGRSGREDFLRWIREYLVELSV